MANTRKVLLSLHSEVADRLSQEKNKSAIVDALVAAHYGLSFEAGTSASSARQSILDSFKAGSTEDTAEVVTDTEDAPVADVVSPIVQETPVDTVTETAGLVAPQRGEAQPTAVSEDDGFVPVVAPISQVEPTSEVQPAQPEVEPQPVAVAVASVNTCPTCGEPMVTPICLNCL